jgi:hypothetical protein
MFAGILLESIAVEPADSLYYFARFGMARGGHRADDRRSRSPRFSIHRTVSAPSATFRVVPRYRGRKAKEAIMNKRALPAAALLAAMILSVPAVAATSEPGRNGVRPVEPALPPAATNPQRAGPTGNAMDAPGGVGPGFTKSEDVAPGVVAPGTIGPNGIEPKP